MAAADEPGLPKATINKLLAESLPSDLKLSAEVRDMFTDCCTEFVNLLSSEANELCEKGNKKTVGPEHVLEAMESLGFSAYSPEVTAALESWKAEDKALGARKAKLKGKDTGMSVEEAAAAQAQLFAAARASCYGEQPADGGAGPAAP